MKNIFIKLLLITSDLIGLDDFELLIELLRNPPLREHLPPGAGGVPDLPERAGGPDGGAGISALGAGPAGAG